MRSVLSVNSSRPHQLIAGSWWEGRAARALLSWETGSMSGWENFRETVEPDQREETCPRGRE